MITTVATNQIEPKVELELEHSTFELLMGLAILAVVSGIVLYFLFGPKAVIISTFIWVAVITPVVVVTNDPPLPEGSTIRVQPGQKLVGEVCTSMMPVCEMFTSPVSFERGIRFSLRDAVQMAATYDRGDLQAVFRDRVTGLVMYAASTSHWSRKEWINDPDRLFEVLANMNVDLDLVEDEVNKCRFVPNIITRELIKASRGSEPITDEQWEAMTTS